MGTITGPMAPSVSVNRRESGEFIMYIGWFNRGDTVQLPDTDRYGYSVEDDGSVLFAREETVKYELYYPNGPRCGPACKRVITSD